MKYQELVDVYSALEATTKRLEKTEIIAEYLKKLDCDTIEKVGLLILGVVFPAWSSEEIGIGVPTLQDIVKELLKPGRDIREDMPLPELRSDILSMEDLKPDMVLDGVVRNVIDFGAFVDIGVHQDGLVHISQISNAFISHPSDVLKVGEKVKVKVLSVDLQKKRISLTMKGIE